MILEPLFGLSLVLNVSLSASPPQMADPNIGGDMSVRQKQAALLPLVRKATDCIARRVATDPRYSNDVRPVGFNDLIVDSISACARPVRAMIQAHDRMYGNGSGEAFLLGPYLDVLPAAVVKQVKAR